MRSASDAWLSQVVNDMYGSVLHLCYKKAGASLAVIQQVAEKTAEKTAKQVSPLVSAERANRKTSSSISSGGLLSWHLFSLHLAKYVSPRFVKLFVLKPWVRGYVKPFCVGY